MKNAIQYVWGYCKNLLFVERTIAKAAEKLRLVGANVLGSVLTAARMKSSS